MRKRILAVIIIFFITGIVLYVNIGKQILYSKTTNHLSDIGVSKNQVSSIKIDHSFANIILSYDEWAIRIIYKDEPDAFYYYTYKNSKIIPGGVAGKTVSGGYKHSEQSS